MPLPPIGCAYLKIIAEKLLSAFTEVKSRSPNAVAAGAEKEVSALLQSRLNAMIEDDPLWRQLVLCAVRGGESLSFNGQKIENRPDLSLMLSGRHCSFPLTIEAKILDAAQGKNIKLYCSKGLQRFVDGEYGWACREAFMLAYVRDGATIASDLSSHLQSAQACVPPELGIETLPEPIALAGADLARSRHTRSFTYLGTVANDPGPISIWHLWLS